MNRRGFLAAGALMPRALAQHAQQTHVDSAVNAPPLKSSVVKSKSLKATGDAPGAKAYTHFNGPTKQLAAVATGMCTLEPGAQPHPPHRHPEEEFMIVGSGSGEFFVNGVTTPVQTGDMVYAEANVLHGVRNTGNTVMTFYFTKILARNA